MRVNNSRAAGPPADRLAAIDTLGLPPGPTAYLKDRWLDQLLWFEAKAAKNQTDHRRFRIVALIGGVALPVVVNATANGATTTVRVLAVSLSLVVGIAVAMESFLRPGERWVQFRQTAERLGSEWWLMVSLAGEYSGYPTVAAAQTHFVERVESIVSHDVAGFVAIVTPSIVAATPVPTASPATTQQEGS